MKSFEFMYGDSWYKYEDGMLIKQNSLGKYNSYLHIVCPILKDLQNQLAAIPEDVRPLVMQGLLHAYSYGIVEGKNKKIQEFKSVFNLD